MRNYFIAKNIRLLIFLFALSFTNNSFSQNDSTSIWKIGKIDHSTAEFALSPNGFKDFVAHDFGYEDKFFLVGYSKEKKDFPYVIPGPVDTWGGTWPTAGWRTNEVNILFGIDKLPADGTYKLVINVLDYAKKFVPLIKVTINEQDEKIQLGKEKYDVSKQPHPRMNEPLVDTAALTGYLANATPETIEIPLNISTLKKGGNHITISVVGGSWVMFDAIVLQGAPGVLLKRPGQFFLRQVAAANYELQLDGKLVQPLLVHAQYISGMPKISVQLDGKAIFNETVEQGDYEFEVPMPAVDHAIKSKYKIFENGKLTEEGFVERSKQKIQTLADYVDTRLGTAHSRWMIAPGPWMPFSMVKMSPDNQNAGWQAGYQPTFESVGTFSHIHEWTMGGLGIFATNGNLKTKIGDEQDASSGYRSAINKRTEQAPIGYYNVQLADYNIKAEVTATTRCGFERFTFPQDRDSSRVLIDLHIPSEYDYQLKELKVRKVNDHRIEGYTHQVSPGVWSHDADQDYHLFFVIEFDKPIKQIGSWSDDSIRYGDNLETGALKNAGLFVQFDTKRDSVVQVRSGISLVSIENAAANLKTEVVDLFGWDFNAVRQNQLNAWNDIFNRVKLLPQTGLKNEVL